MKDASRPGDPSDLGQFKIKLIINKELKYDGGACSDF